MASGLGRADTNVTETSRNHVSFNVMPGQQLTDAVYLDSPNGCNRSDARRIARRRRLRDPRIRRLQQRLDRHIRFPSANAFKILTQQGPGSSRPGTTHRRFPIEGDPYVCRLARNRRDTGRRGRSDRPERQSRDRRAARQSHDHQCSDDADRQHHRIDRTRNVRRRGSSTADRRRAGVPHNCSPIRPSSHRRASCSPTSAKRRSGRRPKPNASSPVANDSRAWARWRPASPTTLPISSR